MKAVILAAGYGTRLYPLTLNMPKALLPIAGKPLIDHLLAKIDEVPSIDQVVVVTNSKFSTQFREWAAGHPARKITVLDDGTSSNEDRLGAIGDLKFACSRENISDDVLVLGGDNLFDFSLGEFVDFWQKNGTSIAVYDVRRPELAAKKFGVVEIDSHSRIVGFEEKPAVPKTSLAATLCYLLKKDDLVSIHQCIMEQGMPDNAGTFIQYLAARKPVYAFSFAGHWVDVGSHESLASAKEYFAATVVECGLCRAQKEDFRVIGENSHAYCIVNHEPLKPGHVMVLSKRHVHNMGDLTAQESHSFAQMIDAMLKHIKSVSDDDCIVFMNSGKHSSEAHLHVHVLPSKGSLRALVAGHEGLPQRVRLDKATLEAEKNRILSTIVGAIKTP